MLFTAATSNPAAPHSLTTQLTSGSKDTMASCAAYGSFVWGRVQRLLLMAYLAQWAMLAAIGIGHPDIGVQVCQRREHRPATDTGKCGLL